VPTIGNSVFADTVAGLADALSASGLQLLPGDFGYSDEGERRLLRTLVGCQPEAPVVHDPALRRMLRGLAVPVVETWDLTAHPVDTVIGFSNEGAGAGMARHFLARGRRRLGFVGGADFRAPARAVGFATPLAEAGAPPPVGIVAPGLGIAEGRQAMAELLGRAPEPESAFCASDVLAVGALLECRRRGVAVPGRMAIAGLGNLEIGREPTQALTTVAVPAHEIGRRAGELALDRLRGRAGQRRVVDLGFSILERESTGGPG